MMNKAIVGTLGAVGTSVAAYKLLCPWLGLDIKDISSTAYRTRLFQEALDSKTYLIDFFERNVDENPDKYFLIYNDTIYTFNDIDRKANQVARVLKTLGLNKDDIIAIFMHNEPEFIWTFIGALKLGVPVCTINYNLRHQSLVHCLKTCMAKAVICSSEADIVSAITEVAADIEDVPIYVHNLPPIDLSPPCLSFVDLLSSVPEDRTDKSWREPVNHLDPVAYVFTSGTTGFPKPALLTQIRGLLLMRMIKTDAGLTQQDIVYTCLPLYHSAALFVGVMGVMGAGCTMVLSRKFSATHFWEDCRKHNVTVFQYIGELCRYLLARPPCKEDGKHCIRYGFGNGLRKDIWEEFQDRFKVPQMFDNFSSTEATGSFINRHNKPGAVGRYSPYMAWLDNKSAVLVKYDLDTAQPVRDKKGFCIPVKTGETGLMLMRFPPYIEPEKIYLANPEKVKTKIVYNALQDGDVFFNFGDLLYQDNDYFLYFVDRIGDTFRWKGENVSTLEVANTLTSLAFIFDASVFGVEVPGNDGRVGMACLLLENGNTDLTENMRDEIFRLCEDSLPKYARPLFLRVQTELELTETWKHRKVQLVKEGFDVRRIRDPLYYSDTASKSYSPLTENVYLRFMSGNSKL